MAKKADLEIHKLLKNVFGFDQFKGNQEEIIKSILGGNNTFVLMPTGGGKSLCYQLPALMSKGTAIVVSPLIALMKNQVDMIRNFGTELGIAHVMNSSLSKAELLEVKEDLKSGKTKLLYVAPESLTKDETVDFLRGLKISFVAIDEAGRTQAQEMMSGKGAAQAPNRTGRGVLKVKDAPKPGLPPIRLDGPVREIRVSSNGKVTLVR